ncbi:hypothetical protein [Granulicella arctica]|uniref:hypothetical protein n=1 Tax=Granulicella arctica TaxID=940613 RepID=UPI0021E0D798|nr:hypothetical protein [Granulicella arctica]
MTQTLPVRIWNFVEQNTLDGNEMRSEKRLDQPADGIVICQFPYLGRHVQEIADGKDFATLSHRSRVGNVLKIVQEIVHFLTRENIFHNQKLSIVHSGFVAYRCSHHHRLMP